MLLGEAGLRRLEAAEEVVEFGFALQLAQVLGVGRGDVHRDVARQGVHFFQAGEVVVGGTLDRGVEVLADVDAEDAAVLRRTHVREQDVDAVVVEAHAIDDAPHLGQAEHARAGVARLRARRDRADLEEAETEAGEAVDRLAVLVEPGGEADAVGKAQAHDLDRARRLRLGGGQQLAGIVQAMQGEVVGGLGVEREQEGAGEFVEHREIVASRPDRRAP